MLVVSAARGRYRLGHYRAITKVPRDIPPRTLLKSSSQNRYSAREEDNQGYFYTDVRMHRIGGLSSRASQIAKYEIRSSCSFTIFNSLLGRPVEGFAIWPPLLATSDSLIQVLLMFPRHFYVLREREIVSNRRQRLFLRRRHWQVRCVVVTVSRPYSSMSHFATAGSLRPKFNSEPCW